MTRVSRKYDDSGDAPLARLAGAQHGVVALEQLRVLGYSKDAIYTRTRTSRLHRLHRGVYAVGHTKLTLRARWLAGVLACGPGTLLSHRAAAALHDLRPIPSGPIDVTAPAKHAIKGVRCHVCGAIDAGDATRLDAIPVSTVERTLLDLAEILRPQQLRSALEAAQRRDALDLGRMRALIARSRGRHGLKPLERALAHLTDEAPWLQSELERAFLELVRDARLPAPRANVLVEGELVDFHWPEHRLIVEVDGYRFHRTKRSFDDDRRRDTKLQVAGQRVVRITYARISHARPALEADLRALLDAKPRRRSA